jgi:hypothetical protein
MSQDREDGDSGCNDRDARHWVLPNEPEASARKLGLDRIQHRGGPLT